MGDVVEHQRLQGGVLVGVGVGAVDHDVGLDPGLLQLLLGQRYAHAVVVRLAVAPAQHDVGVGVAAGADDRHLALLVDAQEVVRVSDRLQRIDGHVEAAVGAVLEAHRA